MTSNLTGAARICGESRLRRTEGPGHLLSLHYLEFQNDIRRMPELSGDLQAVGVSHLPPLLLPKATTTIVPEGRVRWSGSLKPEEGLGRIGCP